jgi:hypothetical protein
MTASPKRKNTLNLIKIGDNQSFGAHEIIFRLLSGHSGISISRNRQWRFATIYFKALVRFKGAVALLSALKCTLVAESCRRPTSFNQVGKSFFITIRSLQTTPTTSLQKFNNRNTKGQACKLVLPDKAGEVNRYLFSL